MAKAITLFHFTRPRDMSDSFPSSYISTHSFLVRHRLVGVARSALQSPYGKSEGPRVPAKQGVSVNRGTGLISLNRFFATVCKKEKRCSDAL